MYENSDSKVKIVVRSVGSKASKPLQHVFQMYVAVCRMVVVVGALISSFDLANISDRTTSLSVSSLDRRTQSGTIRWDTGNGREQIGREKEDVICHCFICRIICNTYVRIVASNHLSV